MDPTLEQNIARVRARSQGGHLNISDRSLSRDVIVWRIGIVAAISELGIGNRAVPSPEGNFIACANGNVRDLVARAAYPPCPICA